MFGILLAAGFPWIGVALWLRTWESEGPMPPSRTIRVAGVTYAALGLGFGVGALVALASLVRDGELTMTWLWQERQRGANLGFATTLPALALVAGFALRFLLAGVPIRVGLVLAGRRTLR